MSNKKVLIIAYYWPPSGGVGVQRWLKFVKYLPSFGWKPFVFTPENPSFTIRDESLSRDVPAEVEVIRFPIWEPYDIFVGLSKLVGSKKSAKPTNLVFNEKRKSVFQTISTWIRGNFFIPDPRIFWVRPSAKFLDVFLRENEITTIITTGPPHSIHLIGYRLKKMNPSLNWVADFRDPWSEWFFLDTIKVGGIARRFHRRLEAKVLATADTIITITPFYVRQLEKLSGRKVTLITNGYDEEDFKTLTFSKTEKFIIRHVGIVNESCNARPFILALKELMNEDESFATSVHLDFVGEMHPDMQAFIQAIPAVAPVTTFTARIPHKELIVKYETSSLLLLVLNGYKDAEGFMPGKLFEYLATGLPILGVGPEHGDAAALLNETQTGRMIDASNTAHIKNFMLQKFQAWQQAGSMSDHSAPGIHLYSRRAVTKQLTQIL